MKMKPILFILSALIFTSILTSRVNACDINDRVCVIESMEANASNIEKQSWRDQTYREIAKTKAFDGNVDGAINMISRIQTPDTKAMTIRGIGMAIADTITDTAKADAEFKKLHDAANDIEHPPSHAIALTYIAMSQAFANNDEGAWATANAMENEALRNKAHGETAEIQAEKGKYEAAMKSISFIKSATFKDKAYTNIAEILADNGYLQEALNAAEKINTPYKKVTAKQYILDVQKPRDVKKKN